MYQTSLPYTQPVSDEPSLSPQTSSSDPKFMAINEPGVILSERNRVWLQEQMNYHQGPLDKEARKRAHPITPASSPTRQAQYKRVKRELSPMRIAYPNACPPLGPRYSLPHNAEDVMIKSEDTERSRATINISRPQLITPKYTTTRTSGKSNPRRIDQNLETRKAINGAYPIFKIQASVTGMYPEDRMDLEPIAHFAYLEACEKLHPELRKNVRKFDDDIAQVVRLFTMPVLEKLLIPLLVNGLYLFI